MRKSFWTDERRAELRRLAVSGMYASDIAIDLKTTHREVLRHCTRHQIDVLRFTPEQQARLDALASVRETRRRAKDVDANKRRKIEERLAAMERSGHSAASVRAAASPSSVGYRAHLPPMPEMSKTQLRAMLAEAVRNTAQMVT
jgi:hypothetical protein